MKTVLFFFLFIFISIYSINAQRIVGVVVDNDSVPIVGAIIQLKQTDSVTIVNYAITDLLGKWTMNCPKKGTYLLSMGSLGCETKTIKIVVNVDEYVTFPMMLTPKVSELTVFEVRGQKIYVKQNGDTLTYKVEGFRNGMEDNIGDLLKNIPSIEVDKDGSIKYKGQRVNKILLEEKDIFSNMHKLFTEGINATDVKSVKIIENYKDKNDFGTNSKTGKVALDVELTDKAKAKMNGSVYAGGGIRDKYDFGLNAYKANKKIGIALFLKANNTGKTLMSPIDYLSLQTSLFGLLKNMTASSGNMENLLPVALKMPYNLRTNNDQIFFGSIDKQINSEVSFKFCPIVLNTNHASESTFNRQYFDALVNFSGKIEEKVKSQLYNFNNNFKWKLNKKLTIECDIPVNYINTHKKALTTGYFAKDFLSTNSQLINSDFTIAPNIIATYNLADSISIGFNFDQTYNRFDSDHNLSDVNVIFDSGFKQIHQNIAKRNFMNYGKIFFKRQFKKYFLEFKIGSSINRNVVEVKTDNFNATFWNGTNKLRSQNISLDFNSGYKLGKFNIENVGTYKKTFINFNNEEQKKVVLINQKLRFQYKFNPNKEISLNVSVNQTLPSLDVVSKLYSISDIRNLKSGNVDYQNVTTNKSILVFYQKQNINVGNIFLANIGYTNTTNSLGVSIENFDNSFLLKHVVIPQSTNYNANLYVGQEIKPINVKFFCNGLLNINQSPILIKGDFYESTLYSVTSNINIDFTKLKKYKIGIGSDIDFSKQTADITYLNSKYLQLSPYIESTVDIDFMKIKTKFIYNYQTNFISKNSFPNLDFTLDFKLMQQKLICSIVGRNLFAFNERNVLRNNFNVTYIEVEQYNLFNGYITAGVKYNF